MHERYASICEHVSAFSVRLLENHYSAFEVKGSAKRSTFSVMFSHDATSVFSCC
jgi:phage protein U